VGDQPETPFDSVESAQQFVETSGRGHREARGEVDADLEIPQAERRLEALRLVSFKLSRLSLHMAASRRLLNDLRTLRRLLLAERDAESDPPGEEGQALPNLPSL